MSRAHALTLLRVVLALSLSFVPFLLTSPTVWPAIIATIAVGITIGVFLSRYRQRGIAAPSDFVVPLELPPPPGLVVGREDETASMQAHLGDNRGEGPRVINVTGPPGIGKSTLALHVAHLVKDLFQDGQLYARFDGGDVVASGQRVVAAFVEALGRPDDPRPRTPEECAERYRVMTANRRVLVLLDDAPDEAWVRAAAPRGPGCALIVTSRARLRLSPDQLPVPVGLLAEPDSLSLLRRLVGPERVDEDPGAAAEIVRVSANHPLALQLTGTALAARPQWKLTAILPHLKQVRDAHRDVPVRDTEHMFALGLSYVLLTEEERGALCLLALRDTPVFVPWMLAALMGLEPDDHNTAWLVTDKLVHARMVEQRSNDSAGVSWFRIHEHVYRYAQLRAAELGPQLCAAALGRLAEAQRRRESERPDRHWERAYQQLEQGRLSRAMKTARDALALAEERRAAAQGALDRREAGAAGDLELAKSEMGKAYVALADINAEAGAINEAWELCAKALDTKSTRSLPRALCCRGTLQRRLRQLPAATYSLNQALAAIQAHDGPAEEARIWRELAIVRALGEQPRTGLEAAEIALRLCDQAGEAGDRLRPSVLWVQGMVHLHCRQHEEAHQCLAEAYQRAERLDQRVRQAWINQMRARVTLDEAERGKRWLFDDSRTFALRAMDIFTAIRHRYGLGHGRLVAGRSYLAEGRVADALPLLEEAVETFKNCGDRWIEAKASCVLAEARRRIGDVDTAKALLRDAERLFGDVGDERERRRAWIAVAATAIASPAGELALNPGGSRAWSLLAPLAGMGTKGT